MASLICGICTCLKYWDKQCFRIKLLGIFCDNIWKQFCSYWSIRDPLLRFSCLASVGIHICISSKIASHPALRKRKPSRMLEFLIACDWWKPHLRFFRIPPTHTLCMIWMWKHSPQNLYYIEHIQIVYFCRTRGPSLATLVSDWLPHSLSNYYLKDLTDVTDFINTTLRPN